MPVWVSIVIVHILSYTLDEWNNLYQISFIRIKAAQNSSDEIAINRSVVMRISYAGL